MNSEQPIAHLLSNKKMINCAVFCVPKKNSFLVKLKQKRLSDKSIRKRAINYELIED